MYQSKWAPKPVEQEDKVCFPKDCKRCVNTHNGQDNELRPTSSLSASAPTFSPTTTAPPPDVSSDDAFGQTGAAQDDLFDDVIPVDESMRVRSDDDLFSDDFTPVAQPVVEQVPPAPTRSRDEPRGRGRGRGRGKGGPPTRNDSNGGLPTVIKSEEAEAPQEAKAPEHAPTGPRKESVASVRGNRQATGGVKKPKLTEEELAEKMARIQIKNAELSAAHARAEADAASFAEQESQAKQKAAQRQKEERRDRQQMMGEREKNRMRKLKAMEGREWDAEKQEDDFQRGGTHDKRGGFAGDKEGYSDGREYLYQEPRGGRGGGRGGRGGKVGEQRAPRQEDFPALSSSTSTNAARPAVSSMPSTGGQGSWADQVESSTT